jgi:hypothetical protein
MRQHGGVVTRKSDPAGVSVSLLPDIEKVSVKVGRLVLGSAPEGLVVDFEGNASGPLAARSLVTPDRVSIDAAVANRQPVVLLFENGDPRLPIVVGLFPVDPGAALFGSLLNPSRAVAPAQPTEARIDGKRVVLEGKDEIVLKCGDASITLKRDGKLILRGAYVETQATGVNRIKGGSVKIN